MSAPTLTSSPASAALPSQPDLPGFAPSSSVRSTRGAGTSCGEHGPGCRCGMTCGRSGWHTPESHERTHAPRNCGHGTVPLANQLESISSPPAFPVSPPPAPVSSEERRTIAGSGRRLFECYPKSGPLGRCLRILLESETWGSPEFSLAWKPRVTKCQSLVYQLVPSARRTSGCGTGSLGDGWRTPHGMDCEKYDHNHGPTGNELGRQCNAAWPTPKQPQGSACRTEKNMNHLHRTDDVIPINGEATSGCLARTESFVVRLTTLSAWLMGYTARYLAHWETASSRKSRGKS